MDGFDIPLGHRRGGGGQGGRDTVLKRVTRLQHQPDGEGREGGRDREEGGSMGSGGFGQVNQLAKPLLDALDAGKDGKVAEAEFAGAKKHFGEWDANKDGVLDQKETADGFQEQIPAPKFGSPPKP